MKSADDEYRYGADDLPKPKNPFYYTYAAIMKLVMYFIFGTGSVALAILLFPLMRLFLHPQARFRVCARRVVSASFRFFIRLMCCCGIMRVRVSDRAAFRQLKSKIVVANHPSHLDIVYMISLLPNADCIVRGSLVRTPLRGVIKSLYIVNDQNFDELLTQARRSLEEGGCLIIFPEGTRTPRHGTNPYKRGAARIAIETGCDVQPVYIGGNDKYGLGKHDAFFSYNRTERYFYDICLLPAIELKDYDGLEPQIAARRLTEKMHKRISAEAFMRDNRIL